MKKLKISRTLSLPIDFVTGTQGIVATKGMGKSHLAQVETEELLDAGQQIVAIDPTDAWWGLRSSANGKRAGYPIAVFGGRHGDVRLDPDSAIALADAVMSERFSCVICTKGLSSTREVRFVREFLERIYQENREPLHIFVDEADMFAPQKPFDPEDAKSIRAMSNIVRRGRNNGIGCTMITQRPSVLNKDVLSQVDMLMVLGMGHNLDIEPIEKWMRLRKQKLGGNAKAVALIEEMLDSLPSLPQGDAWAWSPRTKLHARFRAREKRTFDSGATPKVGQRRRTAKRLAPVDIKRLGAAIAETVERQKADDPKALRAELARWKKAHDELQAGMEREIKRKLEKGKPVPTKTIEIEKPVISKAAVIALERSLARGDKAVAATSVIAERAGEMMKKAAELIAASGLRMEAELAKVRQLLDRGLAPVPDGRLPPELEATARAMQSHHLATAKIGAPPLPPRRIARVAHANGARPAGPIGGGLRRIMVALAQRRAGLTNRQIGIRAGLSSKSGTFSTYLSRARQEQWIADVGDRRMITEQGLSALGHFEPLPIGRALGEFWLNELGGGASRILRVLIEANGAEVDAATIGERAGLSPQSGTYSTYISKLRGLELIVGRGSLRISEELLS